MLMLSSVGFGPRDPFRCVFRPSGIDSWVAIELRSPEPFAPPPLLLLPFFS